MNNKFKKICFRDGVTIVELIIAVAMVTIIFAAILPQFVVMRNSWDIKQASAESNQNGRVLMDHISRNLSSAKQITAVSASSIDFNDFNDVNWRYDISGNNYVEFGQPGNLADLAGPVNSLTFTCYDACDLGTPITEANSVRLVKVEAVFTNSSSTGQNKTFTAYVYLRANGNNQAALSGGTALEYDISNGQTPALAQIDSTHYLCAYTGPGSDGWAVVLTVDTSNATVTAGTAFEFDTSSGDSPALVKIDSTHFLCAYMGPNSDGFAVVLTVNLSGWTITKEGTAYEYDTGNGETPALSQIDSTHYLCAYDGGQDDGWAVVLIVNSGTWAVSKGTAFEYDTANGQMPALARIDSTHHLCAYTGPQGDGWAVVLLVNNGTWNVSLAGAPFEFDTSNGSTTCLAQIDSTHYLCAYTAPNAGWAVVLEVDTGAWSISASGAAVGFDTSNGGTPSLAQIDSTNYLCAYDGPGNDGWTIVLNVDNSTWAITGGLTLEYDIDQGLTPALAQIDTDNFICAYTGSGSDGYAVIINLGEELRP